MIIDQRYDTPVQSVGSISSSRALVPVERPSVPAVLPPEAFEDAIEFDPGAASKNKVTFRNMSPRQMVEITMDLYVAGAISWEEYALLAFQPELHPDFDRTIGALTGRKAEPDRPRDFIALWEDRLIFEERYSPKGSHQVENTERVVNVLRQIESPIDVFA